MCATQEETIIMFRLFVKSTYGAYEFTMKIEMENASELLKEARRAARSRSATVASLASIQVRVRDCRRWSLKLHNAVKKWYETREEASVGRKIHEATDAKLRAALGVSRRKCNKMWRSSMAAWWTRVQQAIQQRGQAAEDTTVAAVGAWNPFDPDAATVGAWNPYDPDAATVGACKPFDAATVGAWKPFDAATVGACKPFDAATVGAWKPFDASAACFAPPAKPRGRRHGAK
jgi:hypothetical protein